MYLRTFAFQYSGQKPCMLKISTQIYKGGTNISYNFYPNTRETQICKGSTNISYNLYTNTREAQIFHTISTQIQGKHKYSIQFLPKYKGNTNISYNFYTNTRQVKFKQISCKIGYLKLINFNK